MKICIYGAGAIGGYLGTKLTEAGVDLALIARGPHLAAMRSNGLTLIEGDERTVVQPRCTDDPAELGVQDFVIVTLKAQSAPAVVDAMQPLLGPDTAVVTAMNGIPWWYFHALPGPHEGHRLNAVDPDGKQWAGIGPERAIGCVVYPAAEVVEPGVIAHAYGNRFQLGEPDGATSARCKALSKVMTDAGLKAPIRNAIRDDIWLKLWGNLSFNPVSALTQETLEAIAADEGTRAIVRAMMIEAQEVAEALGVSFAVDVDTRIKWAADVGAHRTSMLQDLERGRSMEIDPLVTVVQEMAALAQVDTPTIDVVLALVQQRARAAGCYSSGA